MSDSLIRRLMINMNDWKTRKTSLCQLRYSWAEEEEEEAAVPGLYWCQGGAGGKGNTRQQAWLAELMAVHSLFIYNVFSFF